MDKSLEVDTIIIGCGISGASTAYHLSVVEKQKVLVLEKGPLFVTGGSTSHAPGGCLPYSLGNRLMTRWGVYSTDFYCALGCYYRTGIITLAKTPERLRQFDLEIKSSREDGVPEQHLPKLLTPTEIQNAVPDIDVQSGGIKGGMFYPTAGRCDAIKAVQKMCEAAEKAGAKIQGNTEVTEIVYCNRSGAVVGVKVHGKSETIRAKNVVIAAGAWARNLFPLPVSSIEHQWVLLENKQTTLQGKSRHQDLTQTEYGLFDFDSGLYYNEFGGLTGIGSYAHKGLIVPDSHMANTNKAEVPFTPQDYTKAKELQEKLLPKLKSKKIIHSFNGFMTFTRDGYPLVGPIPGHQGLWVIECIWVTHGAGAGRSLAEWISKGKPNFEEVPYIKTISAERFPIELGHVPSIWKVQEEAQNVHHNRCALPNFDVLLANRASKPTIPFIKSLL